VSGSVFSRGLKVRFRADVLEHVPRTGSDRAMSEMFRPSDGGLVTRCHIVGGEGEPTQMGPSPCPQSVGAVGAKKYP